MSPEANSLGGFFEQLEEIACKYYLFGAGGFKSIVNKSWAGPASFGNYLFIDRIVAADSPRP